MDKAVDIGPTFLIRHRYLLDLSRLIVVACVGLAAHPLFAIAFETTALLPPSTGSSESVLRLTWAMKPVADTTAKPASMSVGDLPNTWPKGKVKRILLRKQGEPPVTWRPDRVEQFVGIL